MGEKALVIIDMQNSITKNYRDIIDGINQAIDWAVGKEMVVVYIRHENPAPGAGAFKPGSRGAALVDELNVVSDHIFVKTKSNALTSEDFSAFIEGSNLTEFILTGADATACVKSTSMNMRKKGYEVTVISDCVTSYDKKKIPEMLSYYEGKGCTLKTLSEMMEE